MFHLVLLRVLDLSYKYNHFNYSQIPSTIGNLSMLTYLNLSYCFFLGQIPSEVSLLHKLSTLMSYNLLFSPVPNQLANISSMTSLILHNGLIGEFPIGILLLPNLQSYGTTQISKVFIFLTCISFSLKTSIRSQRN